MGRPTFEAVGPQRTEYRNYDDLGRPHEVYDGRTSVTFDYDFYDRMVTQTNGEGETTRLSYDPAGNVLSATRPAPHGGEAVTQYTYDLVNTLTQVIESNGAETNYLWTNQWRYLTATDAEGEVCTWNFDNAGRLASVTMPDLGTTSFGYDAHDNRTGMTQPIGAVTYTYDYLNRLLDETWLGNAHATAAIDSTTRIRDANGNLTDVTQTGSEAVNSRTNGYDNLDRPTSLRR